MPTFSKQYVEPSVYVETQISPIPAIGTAGPFIPCISGTVDSKKEIFSTITRSESGYSDALKYPNSDSTDTVPYAQIDLTRKFTINDNIREYTRSTIGFPVGVTAIPSASGGSLTNGSTYYYRIIAYGAGSEKTKSIEISTTIPGSSGSTGSVELTWTAAPGATSYRVYRGTTSMTYTGYYNTLTNSFTDTGASFDGTASEVVVTDYYVKDVSSYAYIEWSEARFIEDGIGPIAGQTYRVDFFRAKTADDYKPILFYAGQEEAAHKFLGATEVSGNNVLYTLPLGFDLAMANGASAVWCIPDNGSNTTAEQLTKINTITTPAPYSIVFLKGFTQGTSGAGKLSDSDAMLIKNHIIEMSSIEEQKERIAFFGPSVGDYTDSTIVTKYTNTINLLKNRRIVYTYPSDVAVNINGKVITVGGFYIGAALAGLIDSLSLNAPISSQTIVGFERIDDTMIRTIKNTIAPLGALLIDARSKIRHALTTDSTNVITAELKITRIIDYVSSLARNALSGFVNQTDTGGLLSAMAVTVKLLLAQLTNANVLLSYGDISVVRNTVEPRQVDVLFSIQPAGDVNWIHVMMKVQA